MTALRRRETALDMVMRFVGAEYASAERIKAMKFGEVVRYLVALNESGFAALGRCFRGVRGLDYSLLRGRFREAYAGAMSVFPGWVGVADPTLDDGRRLLMHIEYDEHDDLGRTRLMRTLMRRELIAAQNLVALGVDVNARAHQGEMALQLALVGKTEVSRTRTIESIIKAKANLECRDNCGRTPLITAAQFSSGEVVKYLLDAGALVNARAAGDENSPLEGAVLWRRTDICELLMTHGADLRAIHPKTKWTVLMWAASRGVELVVSAAIEAGVDVNHRSISGWTAIMAAAAWGRETIVQQLLDAKADVTAINDRGHTALFIAEDARHDKAAALLREAGGQRCQ